jgi:hypothetical protein
MAAKAYDGPDGAIERRNAGYLELASRFPADAASP